MTDTRPSPDEDELAIRDWLRKRGVGPDADEPQLTAAPARPKDWLDDILDSNAEAVADEEPEPATSTDPDPDPDPDPASTDPEPDPDEEPTPRRRRRPRIELSRNSLADVLADLTPKQRWALMHGTAAAAGLPLGLVTWGTNTAAWFAAGHWTDGSAWVLYALAAAALGLYRRTRRSAFLVAWAGAAPVSSVALGVLLHGTNLT